MTDVKVNCGCGQRVLTCERCKRKYCIHHRSMNPRFCYPCADKILNEYIVK